MKRVCVTIVALFLGAGWIAPSRHAKAAVTNESRKALIARSKLWFPTDVPAMDLRTGPQGPGAFQPGETVACDYLDKKLSGYTPKFVCRLPDGSELKVKYGGGNGEVYAEVAATRLLWALGFGADHMYSVRVVCHGCPEKIGGIVQENGDRLLDPAAVERKRAGRELSDEWSWEELDDVDASVGGATRGERAALKLLAVLIQHTDSKPVQQRLICVDGTHEQDLDGTEETGDRAKAKGTKVNGTKGTKDGEAACAVPMMMINDLGVTFGRANAFNQSERGSVNLDQWAKLPVWKDAEGCVGNLAGSFTGTLKYPVISEEGRQFLSDLLLPLSDDQIRDMFEAARVELRPREPRDGRSGFPALEEWVNAFKQKRAEIAERRCAS